MPKAGTRPSQITKNPELVEIWETIKPVMQFIVDSTQGHWRNSWKTFILRGIQLFRMESPYGPCYPFTFVYLGENGNFYTVDDHPFLIFKKISPFYLRSLFAFFKITNFDINDIRAPLACACINAAVKMAKENKRSESRALINTAKHLLKKIS